MDGLMYKKLYESPEFKESEEAPEAVLGAEYTPEMTRFRVWAPLAEQVKLKLYSCGTAEEAQKQQLEDLKKILPMQKNQNKNENNVWEITLHGDWNGIYYTYEVIRQGKAEECVDIYAKACGANGKRGMVVNLKETDPEGWCEDAGWKQTKENKVIYELHIKDFSYHQASGITHKYRGKYLAFLEWTGKRTGIGYLKQLGISHVHLLPTFDFASVDETGDNDQFNWGYDPQNFNIPEGSYATDARHGEVRIKEFKQMVQALHQAGIGVIMDVVYNHTFSADSNFQTLAPFYYYRQNPDGSLSDGSACGNETASERRMCGKFILESVLYWAEEYHIDGFRFDLMGLHDTDTMNRIRKGLNDRFPGKNILLYGEPWVAGNSPIEEGFYPSVKSNIDKLDKGIAIFSDNTRDTIKGHVFYGETPGFVNGGEWLEQGIISAYQAWCDGGHDFAPISPAQIISYVSAHDNYTLWDKLDYTYESQQKEKKIEKQNALLRQNKLAAGIIFTCLGTPFLQAGEEFCRTKYGDDNSYKSSPSINCLDWERREQFDDMVEYYRGLIALRGQIPIYQNQTLETVKAVQVYGFQDKQVEICLNLEDYHGACCPWKKIYIVVNASDREAVTSIPFGRYQKLVDEKSSWQWKKSVLWSKMKKRTTKVRTAPCAIGIWGELP